MSARAGGDEAATDAVLERAVGGVRRALRARRGLIGAAIGVGAAGALSWAGLPGAWIAGLLPVAVGLGWPTPTRAAARRLDAAAGLDDALVCAWDHRARAGAMIEAQRARALTALAARGRVRAVPRPSPLWALAGALWVGPLIADDGRVEPTASPSAPGVEPIAAAPRETDPTTTAPPPEERGARAQAAPPNEVPDDEPDAGLEAGDGGPGGEPTGVAPQGGVGALAADERGAGAGRDEAAVRAGAGVGLRVPVAGGDAEASGKPGRAVVGRTPPPPDAIADPARPYPSRYRRVIGAWFDRSAR